MIDRSPQLLILLIAMLTILGFVAGYCVASIRVRVAARKVIKSAEDALKVNDALIRRESVLQAHLQLQTKRSNRLETQLKAVEAQRSLPPCYSDDSSSATSDQESPGKKLAVEDLPTLSRRVGSAASSSVPEDSALQGSARVKTLRPLSSELEIPVLAESELPDTSEEWQADSSDGHSSDRAGRRG